MSYGAFGKQAARYRESEVLSASPGQLVLIVYEHLLINLRRAALLVEAKDANARSDSLDRARAALTELLVTLDHKQGGEIAARLSAIYVFMLSELSVLGVKPDAARLGAIIALLGELHTAFEQVSSSTSSSALAVAAS
ncbi:MAG: flagellar export chaperone FliS [Gemmatimonadaceae bacterium]